MRPDPGESVEAPSARWSQQAEQAGRSRAPGDQFQPPSALLGMPRSTLYDRPKPLREAVLRIMARIDSFDSVDACNGTLLRSGTLRFVHHSRNRRPRPPGRAKPADERAKRESDRANCHENPLLCLRLRNLRTCGIHRYARSFFFAKGCPSLERESKIKITAKRMAPGTSKVASCPMDCFCVPK